MCCSKPRSASEAIPEFSQLGFNFRGVLRAHSNKQLVDFLKMAKTKLIVDNGRKLRKQVPESFIFLLDNVIDEG